MWLKAKTPIKVSPTKTIAEGETFDAEQYLEAEESALELLAIDAAEEGMPPQAADQAPAKKK